MPVRSALALTFGLGSGVRLLRLAGLVRLRCTRLGRYRRSGKLGLFALAGERLARFVARPSGC